MATQVKFHNVTQSEYSSATTDAGALYFISDNGEIRKGDKHITGTRVYTSTDSTGSTAVASLEILDQAGNKNTEDDFEAPKRGDMLVVTHTLATGKDEQTAYIYKTNGGTYSADGWQACDGNVDASKVILTEDITLAGNYTSIGNFNKGSTSGSSKTYLNGGSTSGVSVFELIKQMLSQTVEPTWQRNPPTASISATGAGTVEFGTNVSATFTASLNDAYAKYTGGSNQMAGCSATSYKFDGAETGTSTNTVTKSWQAGVDSIPSASVIIDYSASTKSIKNNVGDTASITPSSIDAGSTASVSTSSSVTTYRKTFYVTKTLANKLTDAEIRALSSSDIRNFTGVQNLPTSLVHGSAAQFLIFVPTSYSKSITGAETSKGLPYAFTKVQKADGTGDYTVSVEGANGSASVTYYVWQDLEGSDVSSDTMKIVWG